MTYPDDVMKAAAVAHAEFADSRVTDNLTVIIARAIMAERQRCEAAAIGELTHSAPGGASEAAARNIASKIRRGDHV